MPKLVLIRRNLLDEAVSPYDFVFSNEWPDEWSSHMSHDGKALDGAKSGNPDPGPGFFGKCLDGSQFVVNSGQTC